jgi:N-acetylmuramoyl-L-alanine amidase
MIGTVQWAATLAKEVPNGQYNELREARLGCMIHYDGSSSDAGAVGWFSDPLCKVSYQALVLDDGSWIQIAPDNKRAYHAGVCRPSEPRLRYRDANSAFFGIAVATNDKADVTPLQTLTAAFLTRRYFEREGWPVTDTWRIVGHRTEAHPRGRKSDPEGADLKNPILSVEDIRQLLGRVVS